MYLKLVDGREKVSYSPLEPMTSTTTATNNHLPHSNPSERYGLTDARYRDNPRRNRFSSLRALSDPKYRSYCPIKVILALSLRVGNVTGTSVEDVVRQALRGSNEGPLAIWERKSSTLSSMRRS